MRPLAGSNLQKKILAVYFKLGPKQGYDEKKEIAAILQKMPKPKLTPPQQS
jgi:hypothetical protein